MTLTFKLIKYLKESSFDIKFNSDKKEEEIEFQAYEFPYFMSSFMLFKYDYWSC